MTAQEREANEAIRDALEALRRAERAAEVVGYGSLVLGALAEAQRAALYALDTAEGRL